jgi:hypothetical protein
VALNQLRFLPDVFIPPMATVSGGDELRDWARKFGLPAVVKLDGAWGGRHVTLLRKESDIGPAFLRMRTRRGALMRIKHLLVDLDVEAIRSCGGPGVCAQSYMEGRLANIAIACWKGELIAHVVVEVVRSNGPFGMATVVRLVEGAAMAATARSVCRHFQLSGIHGMDFVIEAKSGVPHLIEINPRATRTGHFPLGPGRDLPAALRVAMEGLAAPPCRPAWTCREIALFPAEWLRDCRSPFLSSAFHDVPAEEPELARFYGLSDQSESASAGALRLGITG